MDINGLEFSEFLSRGVQKLVARAMVVANGDRRESRFFGDFMISSVEAAFNRNVHATGGENIPPFLIASISGSCNLHCEGCYSRSNGYCSDCDKPDELSADDWKNIFVQAEDIGINFILLSGGEPLMRRDVIKVASQFRRILFPIFTNGTLIDDEYLEMFIKYRNLLPVFSIEGDSVKTDSRRGEGVFENVKEKMQMLCEAGVPFGVSITVTHENLQEVTSSQFVRSLQDDGCKLVVYVEVVPVTEDMRPLVLTDSDREYLRQRAENLQKNTNKMLFLSFPGDEDKTGGCLAAGKGFFHIDASGNAQPCPFSQYSDTNVKETSLLGALKSPLFTKLRESGILEDENGGCVLFQKKEEVEKML